MKNKFIYILMIIAIVAGAIMVRVKGYNYSTIYSDHKRLEVSMEQQFELNDIKKIADECFSSDTVVRKTTLFNTSFAVDCKELKEEEITTFLNKINEKYSKNFSLKELRRDEVLTEMNAADVANMTDEEVTTLINNIKDKYGLDYTKEEIQATSTFVRLTEINRIRVLDTIKGFIVPMLVTGVLVGLYYAVRFRKLYKNAWILKPLKLAAKLILVLGFILAVIVIVRIPVSSYMGTLLIMAYLGAMLLDNYSSELALETIEAKEKRKRR